MRHTQLASPCAEQVVTPRSLQRGDAGQPTFKVKFLLLWVVADDAWAMLDSGKTTDSNHLYGRHWGTYGFGGSRREGLRGVSGGCSGGTPAHVPQKCDQCVALIMRWGSKRVGRVCGDVGGVGGGGG